VWYVYFLLLSNDDVYVGSTNDLKRRVGSHRQGQVISTKAHLPVAPPDTNGRVATRDLPHVELGELPAVGHYDFLATCTAAAGVAAIPVCVDKPPQDPTHQAAIDMALAFFARTLGRP
jgi:hypothetical protein